MVAALMAAYFSGMWSSVAGARAQSVQVVSPVQAEAATDERDGLGRGEPLEL
jgi:hypothetical protein